MSFLYPLFLWLMALPAVVMMALLATNKDTLERVFSGKMLDKLRISGDGLGKRGHNALLFLLFFLMVIALARPVINKGEKEVVQQGIDLVIALDISRSMQARDFYPSRLEFAKNRIDRLLERFRGDRVGIEAFSGSAFVVCPLSSDLPGVRYLLEHLQSTSTTSRGTDVASAIRGAAEILEEEGDKALLLVTDGGDEEDFSEAIALAKDLNMQVFVWMFAKDKGIPIPGDQGSVMKDTKGNIVLTRRNPVIQELALQTGGAYAVADYDDRDIEALDHLLHAKIRSREQAARNVQERIELFYYPLILGAVVALFALFSWPSRGAKSSAAAMVLIMLMVPPAARSGLLDFQTIKEAQEAYDTKVYDRSSRLYEQLAKNSPKSATWYNLAESYYQEGKYKKALDAYGKVVTETPQIEARKLYNMGNAQVKLGNLEEAAKLYQRSIDLKDDEDARYNLELIKKHQKKPPPQKKDNPQGKPPEKKKSDPDAKKPPDSANAPADDAAKQQQPGRDSEGAQPQQEGQQAKGAQDGEEEKQKSDGDKAVANEPISEQEERKWMQLLQGRQPPSRLYPLVESKNGGEHEKPW